jgi:hypothetical protein
LLEDLAVGSSRFAGWLSGRVAAQLLLMCETIAFSSAVFRGTPRVGSTPFGTVRKQGLDGFAQKPKERVLLPLLDADGNAGVAAERAEFHELPAALIGRRLQIHVLHRMQHQLR